jgi:LCP family protein required for cell wall assembly
MDETKKGKKRLHWGIKLVLILLGIIVALGIAVAVLGLNLLNQITRSDGSLTEPTGSAEITPEPTDEVPDMTPTPTRTPVITPSPEPEATPDPTPAPLSEYYEQTPLTEEQLAQFEKDNSDSRYVNVLLIGADRRATSGRYNADTMMIATVDTVNNRLKLTTLMRDMLVDVPGYGYRKLNSTVALGGVDLLYQTIEHNFHVKVTDYVMVDLHSFVDVVDAIGGVTVEMTAEEISAANDCIAGLNKQLGVEYLWDGFIFADAGPVQLNGKQALGYARIRKLDSEFVRTSRQFKVLNMIFAKFRKFSVTKQYELLYKLLPLVETSMTNDEIIDAAAKLLSTGQRGLMYFRLPVEGLYQNGKWEKHFVFFCDMGAMSVEINNFIFHNADEAKDAVEETPNPSLPPRTPTPTGYITDDGSGSTSSDWSSAPGFSWGSEE